MLLDLIEKLLDRCISLVREQNETKRHFLGDFVDPIYAEFQALHDGYLGSFREYRALLLGDGEFGSKISKLRDRLQEDNLFTSGERAKLLQFNNCNKNNTYKEFINEIGSYLLGNFLHLLGHESTAEVFPVVRNYQVWRNSLSQRLGDAKDETEAIAMLDEIVASMQRQYSNVNIKYIKLKHELTK